MPVYNEVKTVEGVIKRLSDLGLEKRKKEVIVVDDGSTDGTTKLLKKLNSHYKNSPTSLKLRGVHNFKYIYKQRNEGKGAAIGSALQVATGDYVIIQDADLEYDPEEIKKLVVKAEKENLMVVFGSRDREIKNVYLYPHYYWGSKALCWLMNLVFGAKFTDPETCYKLIQTDLLKFIDIGERGFGIEMEIAAKIARLRVPYGEVAITYHPRSFTEGKKIGIKDGVRAIYLIGKYWEHDLHYGIIDRILRKIRLSEVLKYLDINNSQTVADMGCGRQATMGWQLRERLGEYSGLDKEVPSLKIGNIKLFPADLNKKLILRSNSMDIIIGAAILEHLKNHVGFIAECRRILRPRGRLVITTPAPPLADKFLKVLVNLKMIEADEVYDHVHYFSPEELKMIIQEEGMEVVQVKRFLWGLNNLVVAEKK